MSIQCLYDVCFRNAGYGWAIEGVLRSQESWLNRGVAGGKQGQLVDTEEVSYEY